MLQIVVKDPQIYSNGHFVRKPGTLEDLILELFPIYADDYNLYPENFSIEEIVILNAAAWLEFVRDFFADQEFLKGKGGLGSISVTKAHEKDWTEWTKEDYEQFGHGAYRKCIAVFAGVVEDQQLKGIGKDSFLIVDPQGFSYARYVSWSDHYRAHQEDDKLFKDMEREIFFHLIEQEKDEVKTHRSNGEQNAK